MTKEEWKQAEEALTHFFHPVELKDGGSGHCSGVLF